MIWALLNRVKKKRSERKALVQLGRGREEEYHRYIKGQVGKTVTKLGKDPVFRYGPMIRVLGRAGVKRQEGVLCVGCRNIYELDAFEQAGFTGVQGIDLVSTSSRVKVMDMGKMEFADNSFSLVYSGDSLEHAYDVEQAAAEFCRVVKSEGYIVVEMPIKYETNQVDRWDVRDVAGLRALFAPHVRKLETVWRKERLDRLRAVFRVEK